MIQSIVCHADRGRKTNQGRKRPCPRMGAAEKPRLSTLHAVRSARVGAWGAQRASASILRCRQRGCWRALISAIHASLQNLWSYRLLQRTFQRGNQRGRKRSYGSGGAKCKILRMIKALSPLLPLILTFLIRLRGQHQMSCFGMIFQMRNWECSEI